MLSLTCTQVWSGLRDSWLPCVQAVNVLEKTRQEQAVADQKQFRAAFLEAVEAEKEALLDSRRDHKLQHPSTAQAQPCCTPGRSSSSVAVESMKSQIDSLQHEVKAMQDAQKENWKQELSTSMDQLSLQLQRLYAGAQKSKTGQNMLVGNIRKLVQDTIFTA